MKKKIALVISLLLSLSLVACKNQEPSNVVKVGAIAGPEASLIEAAKPIAKKRFGLDIVIVPFTDYNTPNRALAEGSIDANVFQTLPFLNADSKAHGYQLAIIGKTFIFPMGLYSKKMKKLSQLQKGAQIAIPNDPSNEARALLLLQKAELIRLKQNADTTATTVDITENPKGFKIIELDAPELPRALSDVALAAINTTYAISAGLTPAKDALFAEKDDSLYANLIVVRKKDVDSPKLQKLREAIQSTAVLNRAKQLFGTNAIKAWK